MTKSLARKIALLAGLPLLLGAHALRADQPTPRAVAFFNSYSNSAESRLERQHRSAHSFLASPASDFSQAERRLRGGELIIEKLTPPTGTETDGAMLHHWRGTAFAPGAKAADFSRLLRDFDSYPQYFSPQVLQAKLISRNGDQMQAWMRIRQRHVITVVLDATYNVAFAELDARHGSSISRSLQISEVDAAGTRAERTLNATEEHGFLWRMNTYWSYEERDGGLYLQVESLSLTRSVPAGLGWAVRPYVESIPRESLEFTLRSSCNALRQQQTSRNQPNK